MKPSLITLLIILVTGTAWGGTVTIPNQFTAGEPAIASDVNENFSSVKTAVDDNAANIASKQNRIDNSCPEGQAIRTIASDGTVTCEEIADTGIEFNNSWWYNNNVPTTITSLGSISITAPGPGYILLFMNGSCLIPKLVSVAVGIGETNNSMKVSRPVGIIDSEGNPTSFLTFNINWVYPVQAGTYTFYSLARKIDNYCQPSCGNASLTYVNLIGQFIPNRY